MSDMSAAYMILEALDVKLNRNVQNTMRALEKKLSDGGGECEITLKNTGEKLWIYKQDKGFGVYYDDGNIWNKSKKPPVFFSFQGNGLKKLAEFLIEENEKKQATKEEKIKVTNYDKTLKWSDKEKWVVQNLGWSEDDARDLIYAFEGYSNHGYHSMHMEDFSGYTGDQSKKEYDLINRFLHEKNAPKYHGTLYRGLKVSQIADRRKWFEDNLKSGLWKEPGLTSFSYIRKKAEGFKFADSISDPIFLILNGAKSGSIIGFLSIEGGEGEVLYPADIMKRGLKIVDVKTEPHYSETLSRKRGYPVVFKTDYTIYLKE